MKVKVSYTVTISNEEWHHLAVYHGERVTREDVQQLLHDIGQMGLEEQIAEGERRAQARLKDNQAQLSEADA